MSLKPIILGIQVATLALIFTLMQKFGVTVYNIIGALIISASICLNGYMFYADYRRKRWFQKQEEMQNKQEILRKRPVEKEEQPEEKEKE